jgi:H+-translocating NAD(P) transhydrogenase subunit alpha
MIIGVPKESQPGETRVALSPETAKKWVAKGFKIHVERDAGLTAGFPNNAFEAVGSSVVGHGEALKADIVFKVRRPSNQELLGMKPGGILLALLEPYNKDGFFQKLAEMKINAMAMELIPRTSRAQSMDVLSSQANIAGYRAVLEAASQYSRFFPMMMTSAGSAKPAKVAVLGVGVAGLQAISTAKRLGGTVEAYDVRPEVKEQILSVGAKFIDLDVGESGTGEGGYARELSEAAKAKQQQLLTEKLKKFDIIITTANIPGRKSPTLVTEDAVKGMRPGSVIVDMAAANGGNCPLTEADKTVIKHGVKLIGITNYPAMVPSDASHFYGRNLVNLLALLFDEKSKDLNPNFNLADDIIAASLVTYNGEVRIP